MYAVKEAFLTFQGEGLNTGRRAVFVRFAGCNLWSGRLDDRTRPACAQWCDTDFRGTDGVNGGRYTAEQLADVVDRLWGADFPAFVVLTGGEPTLQWDVELATMLDFCDIAIETNGTLDVPLPGIDHITVSPKGAYPLKRKVGTELKLVYPQPEPEADPKRFENDDDLAFQEFYLSPMEVPDREQWMLNMLAAERYVLENPFWRLSLQTHKWIGAP